jgi:hypothetical protein
MRCCDCKLRHDCTDAQNDITAFASCEKRNGLTAEMPFSDCPHIAADGCCALFPDDEVRQPCIEVTCPYTAEKEDANANME